jgi:hypothetical protein
MFGHTFYNQTTRRYVALFGTLFNDISIYRKDNNNVQQQIMKVPLNYGPMEKYLARVQQDPNFTSPAMTLPRMSFEIVNIDYDGERKLAGIVGGKTNGTTPGTAKVQYAPAPYDLTFELNIMVKYSEDGLKIVEQILPFFKPAFTVTAKLMDDSDVLTDVPIVLNSVTVQDSYEGSYDELRAIVWTLNFTLKGYYYGPTTEKKIIKFTDVNFYTSTTTTTVSEQINVQPGLTANGQPTTDITQTIPYANINIEDDWAYIVRIESA